MKFFLLIIVVGLVSAATIRNTKEDNEIEVILPLEALDDSNEVSYKIILGTSSGLGHRCWTKVWVVKICTFITPESQNELSYDVDADESSDEAFTGEIVKETESCDQLGCQMFCKKNHFKKGVCHKKGCECDFE